MCGSEPLIPPCRRPSCGAGGRVLFFNSLNSVRALIFEDLEAAAHMIDQLPT